MAASLSRTHDHRHPLLQQHGGSIVLVVVGLVRWWRALGMVIRDIYSRPGGDLTRFLHAGVEINTCSVTVLVGHPHGPCCIVQHRQFN